MQWMSSAKQRQGVQRRAAVLLTVASLKYLDASPLSLVAPCMLQAQERNRARQVEIAQPAGGWSVEVQGGRQADCSDSQPYSIRAGGRVLSAAGRTRLNLSR